MRKKLDKKIIIAIDGYSSCGKSTFARAIANQMGYIFIDTGAMYRAVTLYALRQNIVDNQLKVVHQLPNVDIEFRFSIDMGRSEIYLNNENVDREIRSVDVNANVSKISQISAVREKLVLIQQKIGVEKGVVMDGRDIGTTVFPDAELKIFMVADPTVRAMRRFKEMNGTIPFEEIEKNIEERDHLDLTRAISPLRRAEDAVVLDNSAMTVEQQMEWFDRLISSILGCR